MFLSITLKGVPPMWMEMHMNRDAVNRKINQLPFFDITNLQGNVHTNVATYLSKMTGRYYIQIDFNQLSTNFLKKESSKCYPLTAQIDEISILNSLKWRLVYFNPTNPFLRKVYLFLDIYQLIFET